MAVLHRFRGRAAAPVLLAGAVSAAVLASSTTPTFAALATRIAGGTTLAGARTLTMQQSDGSDTCTSSSAGGAASSTASCATLNPYGGKLAMVPGEASVVDLSIRNTGTMAATRFTLVGGPCAQSSSGDLSGTATDLCDRYTILVESGGMTIYSGTAAALAGRTVDVLSGLAASEVAAGQSLPMRITATLDAGAGSAYQGLSVSQPLSWTFGA